jgi:hypothetical protein
MSEYAGRFVENGIDVSVLRELTACEPLCHYLWSMPAATEPARYDSAARQQITFMFCDLV